MIGFADIGTVLTTLKAFRHHRSLALPVFLLSLMGCALVLAAEKLQGDVPLGDLDLLAGAKILLIKLDVPDTSGFGTAAAWVSHSDRTFIAVGLSFGAACVMACWRRGAVALAWVMVAVAGVNLGWGRALIAFLALYSLWHVPLLLCSLDESLKLRRDSRYSQRRAPASAILTQWCLGVLSFASFPLLWLGQIYNAASRRFAISPERFEPPSGAVPLRGMPRPRDFQGPDDLVGHPDRKAARS